MVTVSETKTAGARLKDLRGKRSRQQVAADLDMSERTVLRHELGQTPLSRVHVLAYAGYYGVDPSEIEAAA
jgi:hypothetical protein